MPGGCDPSRSIHIEPEVVVASESALPSVEPHPHPERLFTRPLVRVESALGRYRRFDSACCRREHGEEGIPFGADRRAAALGDGIAQNGVMVLLEPPVSLA